MRPSVQVILNKLNAANVKRKPGKIVCNIAGFSFNVNKKDVIGGILEEWFGNWLISQGLNWSQPNTQDWPDLILANGDHLEVKTFNHNATPAFDIANLGAYTKSLLISPERLDDDYIIFSYVLNQGVLHIEDYWVKNIWEISGVSAKNYIAIGGNAVNIRPIDWRSKNCTVFGNRRAYVQAVSQAGQLKLQNFNAAHWFNQVATLYQQKTKAIL
jgi:type II restriction enzyme